MTDDIAADIDDLTVSGFLMACFSAILTLLMFISGERGLQFLSFMTVAISLCWGFAVGALLKFFWKSFTARWKEILEEKNRKTKIKYYYGRQTTILDDI